jgi:hypothetical protein
MQVAIVGASPVTAALETLLGAGGDLSLALTVARTTADHVAQAVGPEGAAILDLPAGESREFVRALGARNLRVVDLGPDLRVPQVTCGFPEAHARGKRVVALPSAAGMAAWVAAGALLEQGLLFGDRLSVYAFGGGTSAALENPAADVAAELGWMLEQRGAPPQRRVGVRVRGGQGLLALVQGELGGEEAQDERLLRSALAFGPGWVRVCGDGSHPESARVSGTGDAEVSAAVDGFAEWILASCALDPAWFPAWAALRALGAMSAGQAPG